MKFNTEGLEGLHSSLTLKVTWNKLSLDQIYILIWLFR